MAEKSVAWTSFRTLEPNPYPYTPMTQSILERGVETSSLAGVGSRGPPTTFHRGYLYLNVEELRWILGCFADVPEEVLLQYLGDEADVAFDRISIRPSLRGLALVASEGSQPARMALHGLTVERRLPDRPAVEPLSDAALLGLVDTHQEFLTEMIGAHVLFSGLAEAYAASVERLLPGSPSRRRIQALVSTWTETKTAEMARRGAALESDERRGAFLEAFGHRCPREMEIAVPRWREKPGTLRQGTSVVRPDATGEPITTDSTGTDSEGGLGRTLARLALYPGSLLERLRENPKNEWLKSYAYLRDLLLDIGRRATVSGHLGAPEDVFYLSFGTARRLLSEPPSRRYTRRRVARAKHEHERNERYSPPLFVDRDFQPIERGPRREESGLSGLGVSEGRVSGRAIVARSPEDVDLSGKSVDAERAILVTEFTDAGWTPLFFQVDGLVMERGSLLSHGSIVAREAGIPAVVNANGAMERIDTGDRIAVDAEAGSIRLLDR
ncbi:hypothetical protein BRC86_07220 [Halobacteriales archaeon QS_3_64_16]|nr:MAG: hypothetical protein BRC86_07220 [Halobacteriales archaeon QS_3_64_16]